MKRAFSFRNNHVLAGSQSEISRNKTTSSQFSLFVNSQHLIYNQRMETNAEKRIDKVFIVGVIIKSLQGLIEIIAGIALLFINTQSIINLIETYTREELVENSQDVFSNFLTYLSQHVLTQNNWLIVFYLLSHGLVKLFLIVGIIHKKLWAYYVFIWILLGFSLYQIYRFGITHSPALFVFTVFDILIVYFTWRESRILKKHLQDL